MLHQLRISPREIYNLDRSIAEHTREPFQGASSVLKAWPHGSLGHDNMYDKGSVKLEGSYENPQALGSREACPPKCRSSHGWPNNDTWLAPRSSTFSTAELTPNLLSQIPQEPSKLKPHERSLALHGDD
jgi:hypothetical protein